MKRTIRTLMLVLGLAASFGANASTTGNDLKKWMDASDRYEQGKSDGGDALFTGLFSGYVGGIADALNGYVICFPKGVPRRQMNAIVKQYMIANPAKWNQPADELVIEALSQPFPCKKR